ncbi:MAG: glycosyltransferase family 2 protein [Chromatiales bacterium]|jgi:hypothetical protein|nr:glycosyltransferase family 2 protein [Chromatiales bacterium]
MSRVDVVVPCYNYARYLRRSVESALSQSGVDVRVLIIDDTSSDETPEVGRQLADVDPRVEFRRHEVNRGHIATYNEGLLEWASAEYSLLLSADDALVPGALRRATELMDRNQDVVMTYGLAIMAQDLDLAHVDPVTHVNEESQVLTSAQFLRRCCSHGNPVPTPTAVTRTAIQHAIGGYRPYLPHSGDMEMWMRFAANGSIGVVRAVQALYRKHDTNMSHQYHSAQLGDRREVIQACEEFFSKWGGRFPDADEWLRAGRVRICDSALGTATWAFDVGDREQALACFRFAEEIYPSVRWSNPWLRLRVKLAVGNAVWRKVSPVLGFVRTFGMTRDDSSTGTGSSSKLIGWWPA